jgi:chemotaxis protein methyltransferase CheR
LKTTDKEFFRIINYINKKYGISLIGKRALVEKRLDNVLTKTQCSSTDEFMDLIEKEEYELLDNILISEMLTNHTFFMRESSHFDI